MRTNIDIDDQLMARAMELTGLRTKRAVVDAALRKLVEWRSRQKLRESFGKFPWEGDLHQMRGRPKRAPKSSSSTARSGSITSAVAARLRSRRWIVCSQPEASRDWWATSSCTKCSAAAARRGRQIRRWFEPLLLVSMVGFDLVPRAVATYQTLRRRGIAPGTVDMIIATYCIEMGAELLTSDRYFEPIRDHLGLRLVA